MIVIDTHIWIWWVSGDASLSPDFRETIERASPEEVGICAISCWEVAKLVELGRLVLSMPIDDWLLRALSDGRLRLLPLTSEVAVQSTRLEGFHRDPADQLIVATAVVHRATLVTADSKIREWQAKRPSSYSLGPVS